MRSVDKLARPGDDLATNALPSLIDLVGGPRAWVGSGPTRSVRAPKRRRNRELPTLKYSAVERLAERLGQSTERLLGVIYVTGRTAQRRAQSGELSADESDRLMPVAAVTRRAIDAFGDEDTARRWLDSENVALGGARPLDLLGSELETAEVESVLTRIEYGDFA